MWYGYEAIEAEHPETTLNEVYEIEIHNCHLTAAKTLKCGHAFRHFGANTGSNLV